MSAVASRRAVRRVACSPRRRGLRHVIRGRTAARSCAVVHALEEANFVLWPVGCTVESQRGSLSLVLVLCIEAELGLDGCTVDAKGVQTLASSASELHVLLTAISVDGEGHLQVHAGNGLGVRKLPDVDMVAADDSRERFNVFADIGDADVLRSGLEEYPGGCPGEWDGSLENNGGDEERHGRVGVVLSRPVGQPDDQCSGNDTDVSKRITDDMKNHGIHAHIAVAVSVATLLAWLLGKSMVVTNVDARVAATAGLAGGQTATRTPCVHGAIITLGVFEQGRLLTRILVIVSGLAVLIVIGIALAGWLSASG